MNKNIWFILVLLFLIVFPESPMASGYSRDPWGSKTWTGSGRPPHWSPKATQQQKPAKPVHPIAPGKPVDPDVDNRPPHGTGGRGGYWRDKYSRWFYHSHRRSGYIYYKEPRVETIIIERERRIPVYIPIQQPSRKQCGGKTITRTDPKTGELIIEYVTGAQDCP